MMQRMTGERPKTRSDPALPATKTTLNSPNSSFAAIENRGFIQLRDFRG